MHTLLEQNNAKIYKGLECVSVSSYHLATLDCSFSLPVFVMPFADHVAERTSWEKEQELKETVQHDLYLSLVNTTDDYVHINSVCLSSLHWALIGVLISVSRYSTIFSTFTGRNTTSALATLLLLSYAKTILYTYNHCSCFID